MLAKLVKDLVNKHEKEINAITHEKEINKITHEKEIEHLKYEKDLSDANHKNDILELKLELSELKRTGNKK
jgi:hypothetical protein